MNASARASKPERVDRVADRPDKARAAAVKCGSGTKKALLMILVSHLSEANGTRCHPSIKRLVDLSEFGRRTVVRGVQEMHDDCIIDKVSRRHNKVTVYDIVCLKPGWAPGQKRHSGTSRSARAAPSEVPERHPEGTREGTTEDVRTAGPLRARDHDDENSPLPSKEPHAAQPKAQRNASGALGTGVELDLASYVVPRTAAPEAPTPLDAPPPAGADDPVELPETALATDDAPPKDTPAPFIKPHFGGPGTAPDGGISIPVHMRVIQQAALDYRERQQRQRRRSA